MKRALAVIAFAMLAACAAQPTKEQSLIDRAIDAMGGAAAGRVKTVT